MNESLRPTEAQLARTERSRATLRTRGVPCKPDPLDAPDDDQVALRGSTDVARRTLVLLAVVQRAEATPRDFLLEKMRSQDLWSAATAGERAFLECQCPDEGLGRRLVARLEAIWVLFWALGHIPQIGWPSEPCNANLLGRLLDERKGIANFAGTARLRPAGEVLDQMSVNHCLFRAIALARQSGGAVPANLDWARPAAMLPVAKCHAATIVCQREQAFDWLSGRVEVNWDMTPG